MRIAEHLTTPLMTLSEFLDWDGDGHQGKLELVHGVVRAMAPSSETHGTIQANLAYVLTDFFRKSGSPCRVITEAGVKPRIDPGRKNLRVPDLVVTCEPPEEGKRIVTEPIVLIEILSPSNEKENWESIQACATVPSVKEIVVLNSERLRAEVFRKDQAGNWPEESEVLALGDKLRLASLDAEIELNEVYANTYMLAKVTRTK